MKVLAHLIYTLFFLNASLLSHAKVSHDSPQTNYQLETLADDLNYPWSIGFMPNGDYLLSMRSGELRILSAKGELGKPIKNTPETYVKGQGGYFDVLIDPDFNQNQLIYLAFAQGNAKNNAICIVKAKLNNGRLENVTLIFKLEPTKRAAFHYGGRMVLLNDGTIVLTTGDGFQYREQSQDPMSQMGKTIRIHRDGTVPTNNPFVSTKNVNNKVYSLGHRNPQGLAYDSANSVIYLHEHGPRGGDEVNIIEAGENYGWPVVTHGINYSGATISPHKTLDGFIDPIKVWVPSVAPSGMAFYDGDVFLAWKGNLFVGTLVNEDLRRLVLDKGKVIEEHIMFTEIGERIRDVKVGPDGLLYILTDDRNGRVIKVSPE